MNSGSSFRHIFKRIAAIKRWFGQKERPDLIRLYLHIGMPKTGTSAIQNFLFSNRSALAKQGVCYPAASLHWSQHVPIVRAMVLSRFPEAQFNPLMPEIDLRNWLDDLMKEIRAENIHTIILSSEFFWSAPAMQLGAGYHEDNGKNFTYIDQVIQDCRTLFSCFDSVKVIVYLRKQDDWLESFYNQQIKNGFPIPEEKDLLQIKNFLLYGKIIGLWRNCFGADNVIVKIFEEVSPQLLPDFCRTVSITKDPALSLVSADADAENTRLTARSTRIMRAALDKKMDRDGMELLRDVLQHTSSVIGNVRRGSRENIFSGEFHKRIHSMYAADNRNLAQSVPAASRYLQERELFSTVIEKDQAAGLIPEERVELLIERIVSDAVTVSGSD